MDIEITQYVIMNKERTKYLENLRRWVMLSKLAGCDELWMFRDYIRPSIRHCKDDIKWLEYYAVNGSNSFRHLKKLVKEGFYIKPITITIKV